MDIIEKFIAAVLAIVHDSRYYYSQKRENEFATDCSDLIIRCLKSSGIATNGASYTGNMVSCLTRFGAFKAIPFDISKAKRGDIFIRHECSNVGHTVLYLGGNKIAEACNSKIGLRETAYYFNRYQYILRYQSAYENNMPLIKEGFKSIEVGFLQLFLNKYSNSRLIVDCEYGPKTKEAVMNFQIKYNLEIDGITGSETWTKIYFIMATSL